jgi:glutathione synthase
MATHYILIDPLENLVIKKDSTLLLAHTLKNLGHNVHLVFTRDFYLSNTHAPYLHVFDFVSSLNESDFTLEKFVLGGERISELKNGDSFHMRLDPPLDSRYLRVCWMLSKLKNFGVKVINDPDGIIQINEKIHAYFQEGSIPTYIGESVADFLSFAEHQKMAGHDSLVLKPLDLFQGIGVEKISIQDSNLSSLFQKKVENLQGPVVAQPYEKSVEQGEVRSIFFKGVELGSILKTPKKGEFLANIAQGASFERVELNETQRKRALHVCHELMAFGVDWVAFDILGDALSEVNITCPGLLVEVSKAMKKNLAVDLIELL